MLDAFGQPVFDRELGTAPTSVELVAYPGLIVRRSFVRDATAIAAEHGVTVEARVERRGLFRATVLTLSGPGDGVKAAARSIGVWQDGYRDSGSGAGPY